jgi:methylmalonyl-CoA/ethylmalonyl-CoA epimerase
MAVPHDVAVRVDHVGIAVEAVDDAEPVLRALGCEKLLDETVEERFRWVYYRLGDASRVELIEPVAGGSFLTEYLAEHGPGLHHVTLEVADVDAVVAHLEDSGVRVVDRAEFDTWTEAFVSPRNATGTLFQLMEYHEGYPDDRLPPEELFVNGVPVEEAAER